MYRVRPVGLGGDGQTDLPSRRAPAGAVIGAVRAGTGGPHTRPVVHRPWGKTTLVRRCWGRPAGDVDRGRPVGQAGLGGPASRAPPGHGHFGGCAWAVSRLQGLERGPGDREAVGAGAGRTGISAGVGPGRGGRDGRDGCPTLHLFKIYSNHPPVKVNKKVPPRPVPPTSDQLFTYFTAGARPPTTSRAPPWAVWPASCSKSGGPDRFGDGRPSGEGGDGEVPDPFLDRPAVLPPTHGDGDDDPSPLSRRT